MRETSEDPVWNILLIDDDEDDYVLIRQMLGEIPRRNIHIQWAARYEDAAKNVIQKDFDALLIDYDLGAHTGLELIERWSKAGVEVPMIMVTGRGSYENDLESMRAGAADYISKSELSGPLLERTIRYAIERKRIEKGLEERVEQRTNELEKTTESLRSSLEELMVMEEELRVQNEELTATQGIFNLEHGYYQHLFEHAPIGYLVTEMNGKIVSANGYASDLLKIPTAILIGKLVQSFVEHKERYEFRTAITQLGALREVQNLRITIKSNRGEMLDCLVFGAPFINSEGKVEKLQWVLVEMRDQNQLKAEIEHEKEVLREQSGGQASAQQAKEKATPREPAEKPRAEGELRETQAYAKAGDQGTIETLSQELRERLMKNQDLESLIILQQLQEEFQALEKRTGKRSSRTVRKTSTDADSDRAGGTDYDTSGASMGK